MENLEENIFNLKILNHSNFPAFGIYIDIYQFAAIVTKEKSAERKFSIGINNKGIVSIDDVYFDINENRKPNLIYLVYCDVDNHIIEQNFRLIDNEYEAQEIEYLSWSSEKIRGNVLIQ